MAEKIIEVEGIGRRSQLISLGILFFVNLINYMDRLTVSAVLIVSTCTNVQEGRVFYAPYPRTR